MSLIARTNRALEVNPPAGDSTLTDHGSNWLWAVTAVFALAFLAYTALGFKPKAGERIFHYIFSIALLVGAITYFAEASDLGFSVVPQVNHLSRGVLRQIFFAKYINWVIAFPSIILALGLLSGISWATILYNIFLSWVWVVSYLVGAYTRSNYKWGFFVFGTLAWVLLAASTLTHGRTSATRVGVSRDYLLLAGWVNFLWLLYPIAWGLSDGGNRIGVTQSFIFFGILDLLLVPVVAFATIALSSKWDYGRLNLHFTQYGRVNRGTSLTEKETTAPASGVVGPSAV